MFSLLSFIVCFPSRAIVSLSSEVCSLLFSLMFIWLVPMLLLSTFFHVFDIFVFANFFTLQVFEDVIHLMRDLFSTVNAWFDTPYHFSLEEVSNFVKFVTIVINLFWAKFFISNLFSVYLMVNFWHCISLLYISNCKNLGQKHFKWP